MSFAERGWGRVPIAAAIAVIGSLGASVAQAQNATPSLGTLRGLSVPGPSPTQYNDIVQNRGWLIALGKALFWDARLGSGGEACATCHFHAGVDPRVTNQLTPGLLRLPAADDKFGGTQPQNGLTAGGNPAGPNITLQPGDFPFHRLSDDRNRRSSILYTTNDVSSSQGVFDGIFQGIERRIFFLTGTRDVCGVGTDGIFKINVGGANKATRKVEPRNTPTTINAVFNYRNFWDGRANNVFNGVDPFGRRTLAKNPAAKVVKTNLLLIPSLTTVALENMSLASQAVGPPNSSFEMACAGRSFASIGKRLIGSFALSGQKVDPSDSVFGLSGPAGYMVGVTGLNYTYDFMIRMAFKSPYYNAIGKFRITPQGQLVSDLINGYSQMELNFSLFFGLAIDAYERTLISDQAPYDSFAQGTTTALTDRQKQGLSLFSGKGKCIACHNGPEFTNAASALFKAAAENGLVERMIMGDGGVALYDQGFYNIGVNPTFEDLGVGDTDPWGQPLSFARQYVGKLQGQASPDSFNINPCTFDVPFSGAPCSFAPSGAAAAGLRVAVDGAFKTPTLRNVGLTPPYFHNGGYSTLKQVVRFYNRGGNRRDIAGGDTTGTGPLGQSRPVGPNMGGSNLDADIQSLGLTDAEEDAIVDFLLTLTDNRVACHAGPFDHPELLVAHGHKTADADNDGKADDRLFRVQAVGKAGYSAALCDPNKGDLFQQNVMGAGRIAVPAN